MSWLDKERWIEGNIDWSESGTGPLTDHRAYSTLTDRIHSIELAYCISLVCKLQNVVCGLITKESPLYLCYAI